ncbi:hypothetical protein K491DRAFT_758688 [Lophiostoma macrostomum CBS 122681]|uniref:Terpenoid synthase n=1 Tax=Lophiostoma macrostomum CBS 122681 TaxID=1314788 RepID=A0A6A6T421_9PLEO|nr:hypothetical protein K491DRAFT_758688 [Lophiostoma macrostomum CBS 122681]
MNCWNILIKSLHSIVFVRMLAIKIGINNADRDGTNDINELLHHHANLRGRWTRMETLSFQIAIDRATTQCMDLLHKVHTALPGELRNEIYTNLIEHSFPSYNLSNVQAYMQHLQAHPLYFLDPRYVPREVGIEITRLLFASNYFDSLYQDINVLDIPTVLAKPHLHDVIPLHCTRRLTISIPGKNLRELDKSIPTLPSSVDGLMFNTYQTLQQCLAPLLTVPDKSTFELLINVENEDKNIRIESILEAIRGVVNVFREEDAEVRVEGRFYRTRSTYPKNLIPFFDIGWREWRDVVKAQEECSGYEY